MTQDQALSDLEDRVKRAGEPNEPEEEDGEPKPKTAREVLEILGDELHCPLCTAATDCEKCVASYKFGDRTGPCTEAARARIRLGGGKIGINEALTVWRDQLEVCRMRLAARKCGAWE